jgi:two-component system osmolarity sensor histidine kinase EnvZ
VSSLKKPFAWLKSGLFWRTFFLLGFFIAISLASWLASFNIVQRTPQAQQLAAQVISIVTITRAALLHSAPAMRTELLFDLASNEGIRIYTLEKTDSVGPAPQIELISEMVAIIRGSLGQETRISSNVNNIKGFWVSFKIDDGDDDASNDDQYWLMLDNERLTHATSLQWLGWAGIVLGLSIFGAALISRLINLPLARITAATHAMAKGLTPQRLPERGPAEIIETNRSFNQMVSDLKQMEQDRAVILAGISHDLRTPLTRMQLEIEMAHLSDAAREGMQGDIAQMAAIIGQFLDYAKPVESTHSCRMNVSDLITQSAHEVARLPNLHMKNIAITPELEMIGNATEILRVFNNLIENARRYGKTADTDTTQIDIRLWLDTSSNRTPWVILEICDHGSGVPEHAIPQMLKPFTRLDAARGQANGAGLGLAIVDRIVGRHGGELHLSNRAGGGLAVEVKFPAYVPSRPSKFKRGTQ